jgi:hypothetical protein
MEGEEESACGCRVRSGTAASPSLPLSISHPRPSHSHLALGALALRPGPGNGRRQPVRAGPGLRRPRGAEGPHRAQRRLRPAAGAEAAGGARAAADEGVGLAAGGALDWDPLPPAGLPGADPVAGDAAGGGQGGGAGGAEGGAGGHELVHVLLVEVEVGDEEVDAAVGGGQAWPGVVARLDVGVAGAVDLLALLQLVGRGEREHDREAAVGVDEAVVGLVPPKEEPPAADRAVVHLVVRCRAGADAEQRDGPVEEEGELHRLRVVVLAEEGDALRGVAEAAGGREPDGVVQAAVDVCVVCRSQIGGLLPVVRAAGPHFRATKDALVWHKFKHLGPRVEKSVRIEKIGVV